MQPKNIFQRNLATEDGVWEKLAISFVINSRGALDWHKKWEWISKSAPIKFYNEYSIKIKAIVNSCQKKLVSKKGFHWKFEEKYRILNWLRDIRFIWRIWKCIQRNLVGGKCNKNKINDTRIDEIKYTIIIVWWHDKFEENKIQHLQEELWWLICNSHRVYENRR